MLVTKQTTLEKFENGALFLRLDLLSTVIRHEKETFRNLVQTGGVWKCRLCFLVLGKLSENDDNHVISLSGISSKMTGDCCVFQVWTENISCIFRVKTRSVHGAGNIYFPSIATPFLWSTFVLLIFRSNLYFVQISSRQSHLWCYPCSIWQYSIYGPVSIHGSYGTHGQCAVHVHGRSV